MKTKHALILLVILALLGVLRILRPIEGFVDAATARKFAASTKTPTPPPTNITPDDALKMLVELRDSNTKAAEYMNKKKEDDMNTLSKLLRFAKMQKAV